MRTVRFFYPASVGAAVLLANVAGAQNSRDFVLRFHRQGDTTSVRGAVITVDHTIDAGNTDAAGKMTLEDLDDGGHIVEVVAHGYQSYEMNFISGPKIQQPLQMELIPVLASDTAKAKGTKTELTFAGFAARQAKGQGKFFSRAELDAAAGQPLANVLKEEAGANIVSGPHGEDILAGKSSASCFAAVVRDGVQVYPYQGATPPNLDKFFPERLSGVELYATAPAELHDAGKCGALVLWSR